MDLVVHEFNTSPDDKMLIFSKSKAFADGKTEMINIVSDRVKILWEKGENPANKHFLLFPQCFQFFSIIVFPKLKAFADNIKGDQYDENTGRIENIVGKLENAVISIFFFSHDVFNWILSQGLFGKN